MTTDEMLELLVCPKCQGKLDQLNDPRAADKSGACAGLACGTCALVYPVREGIPVMLVDEAIPRSQWDGGVRAKKEIC